MPHFDTHGPITVTLDLANATVRVTAADGTAAVIEVQPRNRAHRRDVELAAATTVVHQDGVVRVTSPRRWQAYFVDAGAVDVRVDVPTGSRVDVAAWEADIRVEGALADAALKVESGDVTVARVTGRADITTQSGTVSLREVGGPATVRNGDGDTRVGSAGGDLDLHADNGDIVVDRALASVTAKSAHGDIRIREVGHGEVVAETDTGDVEIGVREGVAVWLDAKSDDGIVDTPLEASGEPDDPASTVRVRARTADGDIVVTRAPAPSTATG
jgi:DUF4097 and DUF4098 domain-containing protein YvlB